jgi:tetratricopeptide (TPR) repeat protein
VSELNPTYADGFNNLGVTLQAQGKLDEAIAAYNKALSLKPDYAAAYYNMGVTLQKQGKLDEAITAYNKALSSKPDYSNACNNMGNALKDQGKLDEAITAYNKALSLKCRTVRTRGTSFILPIGNQKDGSNDKGRPRYSAQAQGAAPC